MFAIKKDYTVKECNPLLLEGHICSFPGECLMLRKLCISLLAADAVRGMLSVSLPFHYLCNVYPTNKYIFRRKFAEHRLGAAKNC